jgi:hypothetical protein
MKRSILVTFADPHGGHRYGLLNPDTVLYEHDADGNELEDYHPELNKIQQYIWDIYQAQIDYVKNFANGDDIIVVADGDLTAGNKHPSRLVSDRPSDQVDIGASNMRPWYAINPKAVKIIKGTGAHTFGYGSSEITITKQLKTEFPNVPIKFCDHALSTINEMPTDISHHGPTAGSRHWLKGNEARYYLRSEMEQEISAGHVPPRLYVRAHYHEDVEETLIIKANGKRYKSTIVILPSLCYIDDFADQAAKSPSRITHGMYVFEIIDGDLGRVIPLTKSVDVRTKDIL